MYVLIVSVYVIIFVNTSHVLYLTAPKGHTETQAQVTANANAQSKHRNSYPLQTTSIDSENGYRSRVQSIRKNRSSNSLSAVGSEATQNSSVQRHENTLEKVRMILFARLLSL
jgi:hypothetical protein